MSHFTKILCSDGLVISVGLGQRRVLEGVGAIAYAGTDSSRAAVYHAPGHTLHEINALTLSLGPQECDFCTGIPATYKLDCNRFELRVGPNRGGQLGGPERPLLLCSECLPYVRRCDGRAFLDFLADRYIEMARERGVLPPGVSKRLARATIEPMLRDVVGGALHHATGPPEEL